MEKRITGKAFVLGDNVDTDQIIPAHYLSLNPSIEAERKMFGRHAMSGVPPRQSGLPEACVCQPTRSGYFVTPHEDERFMRGGTEVRMTGLERVVLVLWYHPENRPREDDLAAIPFRWGRPRHNARGASWPGSTCSLRASSRSAGPSG